MKLSKYKITVSAHGYMDHSAIIEASTKAKAEVHTPHVVNEWLEENDISADSKGLAFVKIEIVK